MNGGDKVPIEQPFNGEVEGDTRRVEPHSDPHSVQSQEGVGPSHNMGPLWKNEGCNKEELFPVAQSSKETPDKYSKVYVRQRHPQYKARPLQPVEDQSQLQEGDNVMAAIIDNWDKAQNQSHFEAERRLKSKIECNTEVLEEAQQLWNLGKSIGMEAVTDHSDFIQNYANMESRDRKEAMELGNRKAHR